MSDLAKIKDVNPPIKHTNMGNEKRNNKLLDKWSFVHLATGIGMGYLLNPLLAILLMALYEPIEIFIISPIVSRVGITFGYETIRNSLADIAVDTVGVLVGYFLLR